MPEPQHQQRGVVCLRCHLHRKVRDVGVIVTMDIMVMVWGQIFIREVVITSLLSKGKTRMEASDSKCIQIWVAQWV